MTEGALDAITLRIEPNTSWADRYSVILSSPYARDRTFPDIDEYHRLAALGPEVRKQIEQYLPRALKASLSTTLSTSLLQQLHTTGEYALRILLGGESRSGRMSQFRRFFRDVLAEAPRGYIPTLTMVSPVDLPIEIMTVLDDDNHPTPFRRMAGAKPAAIHQAARNCFTGFQFSVRRLGATRPNDRLLKRDTDGALQMSLYWYSKLHRAEDLRDYFEALGGLRVAEPRPDPSQAGEWAGLDIAGSLIEHVSDGTGIVKIWCHCRTPNTEPSPNHRLVLAARRPFRRAREIGVTVESLYSVRPPPQSERGPLVYISACQAANSAHHSPATIPDAFIEAGYRAVIAPQVSVGTDAAYEMAIHFFQRLSEPGSAATVGSALVDARNSLMGSGNPSGLLYICYGETSLKWAAGEQRDWVSNGRALDGDLIRID